MTQRPRWLTSSQVSDWAFAGSDIPSRTLNIPTFFYAVSSTAPWSWHRCAETSGSTAADASGNGRTGTYRGSPTFSQGSLVPSAGDADSFAMSVSTVGLGTAALPSVDDFSVMLAFQGDGSGSGARVLARSGTGNWWVRCESGGSMTITTPWGDATSSVSSASLYDGSPHLIHLVNDKDVAITLYFDGAAVGTRLANTGLSGVWYTANATYNEGPYGDYSELALWDRALTADEVVNMATGGGWI